MQYETKNQKVHGINFQHVSICSCSMMRLYFVLISASCPVTPRPIIFYREWYRGNVIFVDYPFQCSGPVAAVEFYAIRAGTFYFSAWRPSATGDSWTLLGYNAIVSEGEGAQVTRRRGGVLGGVRGGGGRK